jgi:hypothetical protein
MEVVVKMQAVITPTDAGAAAEPSKEEGQGETLMLGRFVMVCRDSQTHKARQVPPLLVETSEEKSLWDIGEGASCSAMAQLARSPMSSLLSWWQGHVIRWGLS